MMINLPCEAVSMLTWAYVRTDAGEYVIGSFLLLSRYTYVTLLLCQVRKTLS